MKIRPGKTRSIVSGIAVLLIMIFGVVMMTSFGGPGGVLGPFLIIWILCGLGGAAASFYNAFSRGGLPLYEVDISEEEQDGIYCPNCGRPVGKSHRFCKHCGQRLEGR